jgi:hypothetical protein
MLVHAKCLAFAWDSQASKAYNPDAGPLPGGLYEIDTDSQLTTLTTIRGEWLFQYPGHEGKAPKAGDKPVVVPADTATIKEVVEAKPAPSKIDKRHQKMSDAHKKAMIAGRAAKKAERMAHLEAAAA